MDRRQFAGAALAAAAAARAAAKDPLGLKDDGDNTPFYDLKPGEFPPPGTAVKEAVRLMWVDPIRRRGQLFFDRVWNYDHLFAPARRAVEFTLLPFASVHYHGVPAGLKDLPPGLRMHAELYRDEGGKFSRVLSLADDFTDMARRGRVWRVEEVAPAAGKLVVTDLPADGNADEPGAGRVTLQIGAETRYWKGDRVARADELAPGQLVLANLTGDINNNTDGVGYCTEVFLDQQARDLAAEFQRERHKEWLRWRGLPGWVTAADDKQKSVTVELFPDAELFAGKGQLLDAHVRPDRGVSVACAHDDLRAYRPPSDAVEGRVTAAEAGGPKPGSSGFRFTFAPRLMLEGFRPGRPVRVFPQDGWPMLFIPLEEVYHPKMNP